MLNKLSLLIIVLISLVACHNQQKKTTSTKTVFEKQRLNGTYYVIGIRATKRAKSDSINVFNSMPIFIFSKDNTVKISPDFEFKYFKDSIFKYETDGIFITLKGANNTLKIRYKRFGNKGMKLYLNHKYIKSVDIINKKK